MMIWETWLIYLVAVIGLSLAPGPNGLLALSHGALYGHKKALYTVSGGVIGFVIIIALSMFGIGALLQASSNALTVLKWLGAGYLIWLGIQLWRAPGLSLTTTGNETEQKGSALFRLGLLAALSNPKVVLFFGSFLPQFIDPTRDLLLQFFVMAATFAVVEFFVEYVLARMAFKIRPHIERSGKGFNRVCGGMFIVIGTALPIVR
jgi:threonine/homoserine/homoserine lactone efflux protein